MSDKYLRTQGGWDSKIVQSIRNIGYNKDVSVELATVTAPPPELAIKLDRDGIPVNGDDTLIVAEHLTQHTRKMTFSIQTTSSDAHSHTVNADELEVTIHTALELGDRVFVVIDGDAYYVIDKAVV